jgi:hypothetical protein
MGLEVGRMTVRCTINSKPPTKDEKGGGDDDRARRKREILEEVHRVVRDRIGDPKER